MAPITDARLLTTWAQGLERSEHGRALSLLQAILPDRSLDELADTPLGTRDRLLFELRWRLLGRQMPLVDRCEACGSDVETVLDIPTVLAATRPDPDACGSAMVSDGRALRLRPATTRDLIAVAGYDALAMRRRMLAARLCSTDTEAGPEPVTELSAAELSAISDALALLDPAADIELSMACPACQGTWSAPLDIATVLWREVHAWAGRQLLDVHRLARAYGWSEPAILALPPARRRAYLELVGS